MKLFYLKEKMIWFRENLLIFTWMRLCISVIFIIVYSFLSEIIVYNYYEKFTSPPPFSNMDQTCLREILSDYMNAQIVDPKNTLLIIGDCVAYGHGVIHSFSDYLELKNIKIVNISMHSFTGALMSEVVEEALRLGVKKFLIQLHPFVSYKKDAENWAYNLQLNIHKISLYNKDDIIEKGCEHMPPSKFGALTKDYLRKRSIEAEAHASSMPYSEIWHKLSLFLRNDLLAKWFLFRNRHAFDHASGINRSFYTKMTHRKNDFITQLPESRQAEIFKDAEEFLSVFVIKDPQNTKETLQKYSLILRLALQLKDANAQAVFIMTPTTLNLLEKYTTLSRHDLMFVSKTLQKIVEKYEYSYYDLISSPNIESHMLHYDSLTVMGHKLIADILNPKLNRIFLNNEI